MGDNFMDDNLMDLDLNQEPAEQSGGTVSGFGSWINELETAHGRIYERIRQLEAVTARARQRQSWRRQTRNFFVNGHDPIEPMSNMDGEGGQNGTDNVGVESYVRDGEGCKSNRVHLVAKALEMDLEVKKVDKEGGSFYDCNICLEMAREPILTCCGHLYCWVCFYKLPYVDSTAKECPVCKGEVIDASILPIYGNGDAAHVSETESSLLLPPRPKAQRVESARQQRIVRGLSHIPVAEALRRIRTSIGAIGDHLREMPSDENFNHDNMSRDSQIVQTTDRLRLQSHQFSRVLSESAASLSSISSTLDNAERDTAVVQPEHQILSSAAMALSSTTRNVPDGVSQLENLASIASGSNLPEIRSSSSRRRSGSRLSDVDRENFRQARRRRLL